MVHTLYPRLPKVSTGWFLLGVLMFVLGICMILDWTLGVNLPVISGILDYLKDSGNYEALMLIGVPAGIGMMWQGRDFPIFVFRNHEQIRFDDTAIHAGTSEYPYSSITGMGYDVADDILILHFEQQSPAVIRGLIYPDLEAWYAMLLDRVMPIITQRSERAVVQWKTVSFWTLGISSGGIHYGKKFFVWSDIAWLRTEVGSNEAESYQNLLLQTDKKDYKIPTKKILNLPAFLQIAADYLKKS